MIVQHVHVILDPSNILGLYELLDRGGAADELHPGEEIDTAGEQDREAPEDHLERNTKMLNEAKVKNVLHKNGF